MAKTMSFLVCISYSSDYNRPQVVSPGCFTRLSLVKGKVRSVSKDLQMKGPICWWNILYTCTPGTLL